MVVFLGDFNYRLDGISYDEARDFISQRCFDWLKERDQLHTEMEAGNVFQGMREAVIRFPPTYKFEKNQPGLAGMSMYKFYWILISFLYCFNFNSFTNPGLCLNFWTGWNFSTGYDSGEKKRIPAWCDRILYRDSRPSSVTTCSLDCPVVSSILQ